MSFYRRWALRPLLVSTCNVFAHEGPAFPVLVDRPISEGHVSVWADPDTGNGTFDIYIEGKTLPAEGLQVTLTAKAADQAGALLSARAGLTKSETERQSYRAALPFDREGMWNVELKFKQNNRTEHSVLIPVEVTPPGPNRWEFALFFLPFIIVGFIWVRVLMARRNLPR